MICLPLIYDEIMKYKSYHTVVYAYGIAIIFNIIQHIIFFIIGYIDIKHPSEPCSVFFGLLKATAASPFAIAVCYSLKWVNRYE